MYAVIDIGSNTIRLKTYEYREGNLINIFDKKEFAGLAGYVDKLNNLSEEGILKCLEVLREYKTCLNNVKVDKLLIFATASIRNVNNTKEIVDRIKEELNLTVVVLSGAEEAMYDFKGSKIKYNLPDGLMIDIGGGSSELLFFKDNKVIYKTSLPIGSLNIYNKCIDEILPNKKELEAIKIIVKKYLKEMPKIEDKYDNVCGIGGTIRAALKMKNYLFPNTDNLVLTYNDIDKMIEIAKDDSYRWQVVILKIIPERVFTFTPGLMILKTIMKYYKCKQVYVSKYGVREGYLLANIEEEK